MPAGLLPIILSLLGFSGGSALAGFAAKRFGPKLAAGLGKLLGPRIGGFFGGEGAQSMAGLAGGFAGMEALPALLDDNNAGIEDKLIQAGGTSNAEQLRVQSTMGGIVDDAELRQALEAMGISMDDLLSASGGQVGGLV